MGLDGEGSKQPGSERLDTGVLWTNKYNRAMEKMEVSKAGHSGTVLEFAEGSGKYRS